MITWFHHFDERETALAREGNTLGNAVEALAVAVTALSESKSKAQSTTPGTLLSLTEAAKRLGISRNAHGLKTLIASGRIKTVKLNRRIRIPLAELDRIEVDQTGSVTTKVEKRTNSRAPLGSAVAAEIAKLKL